MGQKYCPTCKKVVDAKALPPYKQKEYNEIMVKQRKVVHQVEDGGSHGCALGDLYVRRKLEKSYFGYKPSVLKSGIQKYARRAELKKGLWCLVEMDLFSLLEWDGAELNAYLRKYPKETRKNTQAQAVRLRSNMVNRLVVMMTEEVNISAWWMPLKIFELYQKWIENRDNASSRKFLVDIYLYLTSQKMIRLISDFHSVYLLPPSYVKDKHVDNLLKIHENIQKQYPSIYADQARVGEVKWGLDMTSYPTRLEPCINGIIYNFENGSDHVFYWIKKLCDLAKEDGVHENKYLKIVWDLIHCYIDRHSECEFVRETICALQEFYKSMTHKEKPIYLYHAVLLLVRRKEIDWTSQAPPIDTPTADIVKLYDDHIHNEKIKIDDYVLDLHTKNMKWSDNCLENFAMEGAFIKNQNDNFLNKEYREIYVLLKQKLDLYHSRGGKLC